jgi:hypothetical protein
MDRVPGAQSVVKTGSDTRIYIVLGFSRVGEDTLQANVCQGTEGALPFKQPASQPPPSRAWWDRTSIDDMIDHRPTTTLTHDLDAIPLLRTDTSMRGKGLCKCLWTDR